MIRNSLKCIPTKEYKKHCNQLKKIYGAPSQQADEDLIFDNLVEIVEYTTEAGRRAISSTPGNANTRLYETFDGKELEPDTGLALLVTITPPTGLSKAQRTLYTTLSIVLATAVGVAIIAVVVKVI